MSVKKDWHKRLGGLTWSGWIAYISYFRDHCNLQLPADIWDRSRAYQAAQSAGWWWPYNDFIVVSDRPTVIHLEQIGPTGWGSHRLHCENGPAIAWSDGWGIHAWHGTQVPADLIETGWDITKIMAEPNAEIRRCAIEKMGWGAYVGAAELTLTDEAPDPGNPGQTIRLYDVPRKVLDLPVRVLVCVNATRERDGGRHTFGLTVPTDCRTALSAAAWTFGLTEAQYTELARAT